MRNITFTPVGKVHTENTSYWRAEDFVAIDRLIRIAQTRLLLGEEVRIYVSELSIRVHSNSDAKTMERDVIRARLGLIDRIIGPYPEPQLTPDEEYELHEALIMSGVNRDITPFIMRALPRAIWLTYSTPLANAYSDEFVGELS